MVVETITCRKKFINKINQIENEFIDEGDARYYTKDWINAEKEATEAHKKGDFKNFDSVKELSDFIEGNVESLQKE